MPASTPSFDHIVVVVEENHSYTGIIGNGQAPYINSLANGGALLTNYHAVTHPSQPNYFALYAGSTFGVADDANHTEPGPTLASVLQGAGKTFAGFIDSGSPRKHNPWESFPEGVTVERNFSAFPSDYSLLPTVSFVIPNQLHDMHDGTIAQGDQWLQSNLGGYAQWTATHNSLLVVVWDEDDFLGTNQVPAILYGAHVNPGQYAESYNHYDLLKTILAAYQLSAPNNAAGASTISSGILVDHLVLGDAGNNTLTGSGFDETFNGLGGDDKAVFSGNLTNYSIQEAGNKVTVIGPDGTDTLLSIEHLRFADGTLDPNDGSVLFDTVYYQQHNLDVFHAGVNALAHFNTSGWHEGRDPNALFDTSAYLAFYKDVAAAGINPLDHYHQTGWTQDRDPSANFDTRLYLIHNPDVAAAHIDPLAHYLASGAAEGRAIYQAIGNTIVGGFDAEYYVFHNPDVAASGADPLQHFNSYGWKEGRNPNAWFDTAGYLAHYPDIAAARVNPLTHYENFGWKEGRDPSASFDTMKYLAANPDVAAAHANPLDHFLQNGIYEGRAAVNDGLWH